MLTAFADAIVARDPSRITTAREAVVAAMGYECALDCAAVASNFERMVRIADGTGIQLGEFLEGASAEARAVLALEP